MCSKEATKGAVEVAGGCIGLGLPPMQPQLLVELLVKRLCSVLGALGGGRRTASDRKGIIWYCGMGICWSRSKESRPRPWPSCRGAADVEERVGVGCQHAEEQPTWRSSVVWECVRVRALVCADYRGPLMRSQGCPRRGAG